MTHIKRLKQDLGLSGVGVDMVLSTPTQKKLGTASLVDKNSLKSFLDLCCLLRVVSMLKSARVASPQLVRSSTHIPES
jgi:hypothetical protein